MEIKRCEKGHFYDAEANAFCPQCAAEQGFGGNGGMGGYGPTEPAGSMNGMEGYGPTEPAGSMNGMEDYGATEPLGGMGGMNGYGATEPLGGMEGYGPTEPLNSFGGADIGATMPLDGSSGFTGGNFEPTGFAGSVEAYDEVTRPIPPAGGGAPGFMPVVGWLVCVEGPARGSDYRIRAGYNYIGRAEHMDICVRGDNTIGRERHALLAYDQEERVFFFGPADGKSIVRLNGKMVMNPQEIKLHDILTVGTTKLMFVPLCGEGFDWNGK